jgi:transaldolase/glucose-6-phosphate isomerase
MTIAVHQLMAMGQTVWLDSISHDLIRSGALTVLITQGIRGGTIDPVSYAPTVTRWRGDAWLAGAPIPRAATGAPDEAVLLADGRQTADLLRATYEQSRGQDGFAGVPINPGLAHNTTGMVAEAQRLYQALARPNVMIAVPATEAGIAALRQLVAAGISVQTTLLFSVDRYKQVVDAYLGGLEQRAAAGQPLSSVAAVAAFGVSPLDHEVDRQLCGLQRGAREGAPLGALDPLLGQAALASARVVYQHFRQQFGSARFTALRAQGAQVQRLLWAGTEVKNPGCADTRYVEALIGPDTIAALALPTLEAFEDHGWLRPMGSTPPDEAEATLHALSERGINLAEVADYLLANGLWAAADPFWRDPVTPRRPVALASSRAAWPPG